MARLNSSPSIADIVFKVKCVAIVIILLIAAPQIYSKLNTGDVDLVNSVKYATNDGYTNKEIFAAIDPDASWYG